MPDLPQLMQDSITKSFHYLPITLAFDPGVTTGVAAFFDEQIYTDELKTYDISPLLQRCTPTVIIVEQFKPRQLQKVDTTPIEIIGVIKDYHNNSAMTEPIVFQSPAQGKFFWTNDKLKKLNLYKPGYPHAMDALRHLLYYLKKEGYRKYIEAVAE